MESKIAEQIQEAENLVTRNLEQIQEHIDKAAELLEQNRLIRYLLKEQGVKEEDLPSSDHDIDTLDLDLALKDHDLDKENAERYKDRFLWQFLSKQ